MKSTSLNNFYRFSNRKDITSVIKSGSAISYQKLFEQANQAAIYLSEKGIKKYDYVPLLLEDSFLFIKTVIALWNLGAVPVPINTKLLKEEVYSIIDDYDFRFIVTDKDISFDYLRSGNEQKKDEINNKDIKPQSLTKINLSEFKDGSNNISIFCTPNLDDEAIVIFTSGSAGRPKGVVHTFSSLINSIENGNKILNQQENDCWLASLPFYHIGGFQIICRSFYYGCSIILPQSLQVNHLAETVTDYKPTHISLVSTQLERLINLKVKPSESLKVSLIGGGFIEDELMFEADKLGWKPFRVYGSSETASFITAISANEIKKKPQSAGKPLNKVEIKISEDSEIFIKTNSLFKKYLEDEKETTIKLLNGFYHSGDLGYLDDDGYLFIEARRTDLIVTGGENVNPIEVEKVIINVEGIKEVCVFPKPNKTWGQIVACVVVSENKLIDENFIKEYLKKHLAGYKIPKQIIFADKLPRTSLGKLEREKIKRLF